MPSFAIKCSNAKQAPKQDDDAELFLPIIIARHKVNPTVIVFSESSAPDGLNKNGKNCDQMLNTEAGALAARWPSGVFLNRLSAGADTAAGRSTRAESANGPAAAAAAAAAGGESVVAGGRAAAADPPPPAALPAAAGRQQQRRRAAGRPVRIATFGWKTCHGS